MPAPPETADDAPAPESRSVLAARLRRRRSKRSLLERVSIQSKLLLMLLTMSVLATAIVGGIGFTSGRSSLRESVFERLTGIREAQTRVLELGLADLNASLVIFSRGETVPGALSAFSSAFDQLGTATIDPAQSKALADYYNARFGGADDGRLDIGALIPTSAPARYLQSRYTVPFADRDKAVRVDDARDGSPWSAANARYNQYFREIVTRMGFRDVYLINARGDVVYSAFKGVELGTNVLTGPYRGEGKLPDAFRKAMRSKDTIAVLIGPNDTLSSDNKKVEEADRNAVEALARAESDTRDSLSLLDAVLKLLATYETTTVTFAGCSLIFALFVVIRQFKL